LRRRADTAGVGDRVHGVQGDGDLLHEVLSAPDDGTPGYDLGLCHYVLEVVDDPAIPLREIARALRPGGQVSIATANRAGAVLARAVSGHPVEALALLEDRDLAPARADGVASPSSPICSNPPPALNRRPSAPSRSPSPRPRPTATSPPACTS